MPADTYRSFRDLAAREREGIDYRIVALSRDPAVAIIAPHGGAIEPPTSRIAAQIAGSDFSLYCFEGLSETRNHHDLHITSRHFDEPLGCAIVNRADIVVAIHGRQDRDDPTTIYVGGLDRHLKSSICENLSADGFAAIENGHRFPAIDPDNICNRGLRHAGVQLELPRSLRDDLATSPARMTAFTAAIQRAIFNEMQRSQGRA